MGVGVGVGAADIPYSMVVLLLLLLVRTDNPLEDIITYVPKRNPDPIPLMYLYNFHVAFSNL